MPQAGEAILNQIVGMSDVSGADLETMIREHSRFVYRVAYSVLRNHHDAEDVAQETFLRATRHRHELDQVLQPRAGLARIAWRVALDHRRVRAVLSLDDAGEHVGRLTAAGLTAEQVAADSQMQALLEKLIALLPRRLREVLVLSTVEEMSSGQIAVILGIREVSVRSRLHRARQVLRRKLIQVLEKPYDR
jgi:RNA polymerase sigma-70 factor (ECF subfamily)